MKRTIAIFILAFIGLSVFAQSPQGKVLEGLSMESKVLKTTVNYTIYLPPDYDISQRSYPVVYLLHGYTGSDTDWVQYGNLEHTVNTGIANGELAQMIIVTPDGENNWYVNFYDESVMYENMFVNEFIPFIEKNYRIRGTKEFRAISGLSMGGHGSLVMALKHPDLFAACAPLSAAIYTDEQHMNRKQDSYEAYFGMIFGPGLEGQARITDHYKSYAALHLVAEMPVEEVSKLRYYIDCGDDDHLTIGNSELHILMDQREIPHEYRVRDGAHNWTYWRIALPDALKFISESFTR